MAAYKNSSWLKNLIMVCYSLSIILMMNFSSIIMFWLMLELNMVVFIMMMSMEQSKNVENEMSHQYLFYFMIQSLGSILFLMAAIFMNSNMQEFKELFMLSAITLKAGLIPFETWLFKLSKFLSLKMFIFIITAQKIPMFIVMSSLQNIWMICILLLNAMLGSYYLWKSISMKQILISSSIYTTMWLILTLYINILSFLTIFAKYTIAISLMATNMKKKLNVMTTNEKFSMILCLIFLLGIPPMDMFFFKIFSLKILMEYKMWWILTFLWMATFLSTMAYSTKMINFTKMNKLMYQTKMNKPHKYHLIFPLILMLLYI